MRVGLWFVPLVLLTWTNFILLAIWTGRADPLAWAAATVVSAVGAAIVAQPGAVRPSCVECGQPMRPAPFCLGCGRVPKAMRA